MARIIYHVISVFHKYQAHLIIGMSIILAEINNNSGRNYNYY